MVAPEEKRSWIGKAVEPLGENSEWKLRAESLLDERIAREAEAGLPDLKGRPRRSWLVILLGVLLMTPLVWKTVGDARMVVEIMRYFGVVSWSGPLDPADLDALHVEGLSEVDAEFLIGDTTKAEGVARWESVIERHPDDPAMLAFFAGRWIQHEKMLPDELVDDAAEIDAGNGWYDLMLAGLLADGAVEEKAGGSSLAPRDIEKPIGWTIHDAAGLEASMDHLRQAALADRIEDWTIGLNLRRLERLPDGVGIPENARRQSYSAQTSAPGILLLRHATDAMAAEAQRCAEDSDGVGLRQLIQTHQKLGRLLLEKEGTLVDALVATVFLRAPLANFREAAVSLGLEEEVVARLDCQIKGHVDRRVRMQTSPSDRDFESRMENMAGWAIGKSAPVISRQAEFPPELSEKDLRPGRRAEHALVGRGLAVVAGMLLVGIALLWKRGVNAWSGRFSVLMGRSLGRMFGAGDRLLLFGIGVGLPVLILLGWRFLSPWGGLAWNPGLTVLHVELPQFILTMLLVVWCSKIASRWVVERKLGRAPGGRAARRVPFAAAAFLTAAFPLTGQWAPDENALPFQAGVALGGVGAGLLLLEFVLERGGCFLDRLLRRELTLMAIAFGGLSFLLLGLGFLKEERFWFAKERLMVVSPENPAFGSFETEVARQVQLELKDLVDRCD